MRPHGLPLHPFRLCVGAIVGLTGVGGGSLMTPLLVLLFGVNPATAVGTDLLYAAMTKAGGTVAHGRKGHIDWAITGRLALGSIPAAAITIWVLSQLPKGSNTIGAIISNGLGFALVLTAIAILFGRKAARLRRQARGFAAAPARLGKITVAAGACSACWSPFRRSAPERSASPRCSSFTQNFRRSRLSDPMSPTPYR
jgi:uncharacterized membrane protein YfcA